MSGNIQLINQKIELNFNQIENEIFNGDMFSASRGSFEVKKLYVKKMELMKSLRSLLVMTVLH